MLLILGALLFLIVLVSVVLYVEDRRARHKASAHPGKNLHE